MTFPVYGSLPYNDIIFISRAVKGRQATVSVIACHFCQSFGDHVSYRGCQLIYRKIPKISPSMYKPLQI